MIARYFDLPELFTAVAGQEPGSVLLESSRPDSAEHTSLLFREPKQILQLERPEDAPQFFRSG